MNIAVGAVETVGKPSAFVARLFQAAVEIIKKKMPKATLSISISYVSFHSAFRREFVNDRTC